MLGIIVHLEIKATTFFLELFFNFFSSLVQQNFKVQFQKVFQSFR